MMEVLRRTNVIILIGTNQPKLRVYNKMIGVRYELVGVEDTSPRIRISERSKTIYCLLINKNIETKHHNRAINNK
jgi:hypothetical protein